MRRTRVVAGALVVKVAVAFLLVPLIAHAATGSPGFGGTYTGIAEGSGTGGGGGSTKITAWVEDLGDSARVTLQAAQFGVAVSATGPVTASGDSVTVPISIDSAGVTGEGTMTFVKTGDAWVLTGVGQGNALGYEGSGSLPAQRISAGMNLPSVGTQFSDMFGSVAAGPASAQADDEVSGGINTGGPEGGDPLSPAEPEPPIALDDTVMAAGLAAIVLILQLILA